MLRLNFAPRLMLAMMFIVTLVAGSIFAVTREKLETAWREVIETRFLSQTESLASMQKTRLDSIQERCRELAASDTVIKAVESGTAELPKEIHEELLKRALVVQVSNFSFEAASMQSGPKGPGGPGGPGKPFTPPDVDFQRSSAGSAPSPGIPPADGQNAAPAPSATGSRNQRFSGPDSRRPFRWGRPDFLDLALLDTSGQIRILQSGGGSDAQKEWLVKNKVSSVPASQEVAYMAMKPEIRSPFPADAAAGTGPDGRDPGSRRRRAPGPLLREVIITPIKKPGTEENLGALIVGLPVSTYGESALYDLKRRDKPGELLTGLWIDDQLFSQTIPETVREAVSGIVRRNLATTGTESDISTTTIDGRPYQILFRSLNASPSTPPAYQITLFSLASLEADKSEVRAKVIGFSLLAFGAAMLLSWLLSRRLVHPVQALVEGTRKIKNGLYDTRLAITTHDELATLAAAFNEMAEGLRQRERYRDILFQVSDDDIARQLIETACLGGERREISVLFCDIRSFTATTSGMAPEGIIDMLNEHMTALTEIVHRHHGVVDKFVGDLIMAIFGAPKSYGDDAGNAAACALEMVARREELNRTTAHPPLLMGIGVASGTVVAGCMGSENRLNYTVLGEPVNLASRLCSAAGPREVIIDPHTAVLLGPRAAGHLLRPLLLKGFPDPVQPFHLTRLVEVKTASAAAPGTGTVPPASGEREYLHGEAGSGRV